MPNPDFIIIGAQKSGTSWLHENLNRHPDIWMSGVEMHGWRDYSISKYRQLYDRKERVTGEKGPEYFHMPTYAVRCMTQDLPTTTFFVLLRNPADRAWSQARMECSNYNQTDAPGPYRLLCNCATVRNRQRTRYDRILHTWQEHAGNRLHVYFYEDVCQRPAWLLDQICTILDIPPIEPETSRVWSSPSQPMSPPIQAELEGIYASTVKRLREDNRQIPDEWTSSTSNRPTPLRILTGAIHALTYPYHLYHHLRFSNYWFR